MKYLYQSRFTFYNEYSYVFKITNERLEYKSHISNDECVLKLKHNNDFVFS